MSFGNALMWRMGGDVSGFNKAAGSAEKRGSKLKSTLKTIGPAFSLGVAIGGLMRLTEEMDKTAKTARKLGVGAELLQEMRFAGERTGVAMNAVDMGLQRFTRRMAEARVGTGEMRGVLDQYNISLTNADGSARSNVEVLGSLADVIKNTKDPAEQLRIAFKAFDSEGAALVNTLRDGKAGLDEFRQTARDTGNVVGSDTLSKFEQLSDQVGTLKGGLKTLAANVGGAFLSFGTVIGETAARGVNALQGIETVLGDDIPAASEKAAASMDKIQRSAESINREMETRAKLAEMDRKNAFERANLQEKLNMLRAEEMRIYREQVSPSERGSKEWAEGMVRLAEIDNQWHELKAQLLEEQRNTEEKKTELADKAAKALGEENEARAKSAAVSAQQLQIDKQITDEVNERANTLKSIKAIGGDSVERLDTEKLRFLLEDTKESLNVLRASVRKNPSSFMSESAALSVTGGGSLQEFINRISNELALRTDFKNTQAGMRNIKFDPFQRERLEGVVGGLTQEQETQQILKDIRDRLETQNRRNPLYP